MATGVERFEDLVAWQKARLLTKAVYKTTQRGDFSKDFELRSQIRSACVSVMSNIAEGFDRTRPKEFFHFLTIAKASCAEVRCQLYVALDVNYINQAEFDSLKAQTNEVSRIINALRLSVERKIKNAI